MKHTALISLAALAGAVLLLADTLNVKPGQWEATMTSQMTGLPPIPQEVLDKLTPEQRQMMEQRMKGSQTPRTQISKSCITKEQIEKGFNVGDNDQACARTIVSSSSSKQEIKIECSNGNNKSTGTVRIEASSSESVKGSIQMTMTTGGGRSMNMSNTFTAKWLGPVCEKDSK
ncbi:MAG TPA: DUF3617 domain-containing protein [Bryobacteraceae bacterium]|nr:DUF3617 domain-containing protein [Bryobacteraceae bacterium]